jgi:small-conductance mechanosensitive channel
MKIIYLFIIIVFIVILFLGKSIFSSASAVTSSVTSTASGFQGQRGGKKSCNLRTLLYVILAIAAIIFILSKLDK